MITIGTTQPAFPTAEGNSFGVNFSDNFFRFAVARDNAFNHLTVNPSDPGLLAARLKELASLDRVDNDLAAYSDHGGKLVMLHGTEDMLISSRATEAYYGRLQATMGAEKVAEFPRFYEMPGFGHGASTVFNARWDELPALEDWVEHGKDLAQSQTVVDVVGVPGRGRPLRPYPTWPKYKGSGSINAAASFECVER